MRTVQNRLRSVEKRLWPVQERLWTGRIQWAGPPAAAPSASASRQGVPPIGCVQCVSAPLMGSQRQTMTSPPFAMASSPFAMASSPFTIISQHLPIVSPQLTMTSSGPRSLLTRRQWLRTPCRGQDTRHNGCGYAFLVSNRNGPAQFNSRVGCQRAKRRRRLRQSTASVRFARSDHP